MKVDQDGMAIRIPCRRHQARKRGMVGPMDSLDPPLRLQPGHGPQPQFAGAGHPAGQKAKATAQFRAAVPARIVWRIGDHRGVHLSLVTVEVDHRAWCIGQQKTGLRRLGCRQGKRIDMAVFQAQAGAFGLA